MNDAPMTLTRDYLAAVTDAVARLQQEFGRDRVRQGPNAGQFARAGTLTDGSEYQFHGFGCSMSVGDLDVDFEFATDGRYDGFDIWRLWLFAKQQPGRYPRFTDQQTVETAIRRLVADGKVVGSRDAARPIFFLVDSPARYL